MALCILNNCNKYDSFLKHNLLIKIDLLFLSQQKFIPYNLLKIYCDVIHVRIMYRIERFMHTGGNKFLIHYQITNANCYVHC